ncbi:MAG: hypothetical protein BWZ10_00303 [candidate division BRC1 bacterium ADurb.BinA364]|nr:MAG: hypothetical protein BWZ10_00303 [candidate division BRC1 bacterium ADurb.BinA364]
MPGTMKWTAAAAAMAAAILAGCATFEEENRPVLNKMDKTIRPQSTAARLALGPPCAALGAAAWAVDAAVVRPVAVIPAAADDVYELYWRPRDMDFFRKSLLFVPIVVLTPPTFAVDWAARTLFAID